MAVLKSLVHALQQSRSFEKELQAQWQKPDPNLKILCSCCFDCITDHHDFLPVTGQLLDRNVQVRSHLPIHCTTHRHTMQCSSLQGVCADHAEALRHKETGTSAFRTRDFEQAATSYASMARTKSVCTLLSIQCFNNTGVFCRLLEHAG